MQSKLIGMVVTLACGDIFSRTVRSERLIFSVWHVLACLLVCIYVCGQLFQLLTLGGSPGSDYKYQHQVAHQVLISNINTTWLTRFTKIFF